MSQQLRFVEDEDGMLLARFVQTDDGLRDLCRQIAAVVDRIKVMSDLTQKIERRAGGPVQVNNLDEIAIQTSEPGSGSGELAGTDFSGEKTGAAMIDEELQAGLDPLLAGVFE
jgi:hypothetical protein